MNVNPLQLARKAILGNKLHIRLLLVSPFDNHWGIKSFFYAGTFGPKIRLLATNFMQ